MVEVDSRLTNTSLHLSFPFDTGRGVTTDVADAILLSLVIQAYGIIYGPGHYTIESDVIISSVECLGIITAAGNRICEELWQSVHRRRPTPLFLFTPEEVNMINELQKMSYLSAED